MFSSRASQSHHHLQSYQLRLHADDLQAKIRRVRQFFQGAILPPPTDEVEAAWRELPNHVMPMSLETRALFREGPPPTPTQDVIVKDDPSRDETTLYSRSRYDGFLHREDLHSPTPNEGLHRDQGISESSLRIVTPPSHTNRNSPDRQGFRLKINQWMSHYRARGAEVFVDALLASGIESPDSASLASRLAQSIIKEVRMVSKVEGENLRSTLRFSALAVFKKHWETDGTWLEVSSTSTNTPPLTSCGISVAALIGALFNTEVLSAKDVYLCLSTLLEGNKHVDKLRAMHALLGQANDKLCKTRNYSAMMEFRASVTGKDESGEFVWVTSPYSKGIIDDILATIQRWMALQALKRELH